MSSSGQAVAIEPKAGLSWTTIGIFFAVLALVAALVIAIVALVLAQKAQKSGTTTTTDLTSVKADITRLNENGGTAVPQATRYSGGVGSSDPFQTIVKTGTAVLFHQKTTQSADITYDVDTGEFTAAKAGLYNISFNAPVVLTADADGSGEMMAFVALGTFADANPKYGFNRVAVPDSFAIPALPAWPIACTTQVRLAAGGTFSCMLQLAGAESGIIPGAGATAPLDENPAQANFSCYRVSA